MRSWLLGLLQGRQCWLCGVEIVSAVGADKLWSTPGAVRRRYGKPSPKGRICTRSPVCLSAYPSCDEFVRQYTILSNPHEAPAATATPMGSVEIDLVAALAYQLPPTSPSWCVDSAQVVGWVVDNRLEYQARDSTVRCVGRRIMTCRLNWLLKR